MPVSGGGGGGGAGSGGSGGAAGSGGAEPAECEAYGSRESCCATAGCVWLDNGFGVYPHSCVREDWLCYFSNTVDGVVVDESCPTGMTCVTKQINRPPDDCALGWEETFSTRGYCVEDP